MSEHTARATRRDLRKAFGGAALDTLDRQAEAIGAVIVRVDELGRHLTDDRSKFTSHQAAQDQAELLLQQWIVEAKADVDAMARDYEAATDTILQALGRPVDVIDRGVWGRVRWLVTGR